MSISQLFILLNLYQYIFHILKISHFATPALALNMEPLASQANALPLGYPAMLNIDNLQDYACCTEKLYFIFATGCRTPQGCCQTNAICSDSRFVMSQYKNISLLIVTDIKVNRNFVLVFWNFYFNGGQETPPTLK